MLFSTAAAVTAFLATSAFAAPTQIEERQAPAPVPSVVGASVPGSAYGNLDLIAKLILAPLQADRVELLADADFKFDFRNPPGNLNVATGNAGRTVAANRKTMPALIGTGSGMAMGFLGPCGFNTPHVHGRGTELNVVVVGSLTTTMILENGVRAVHHNVSTYQMGVFPQGAYHQEFNPDCGETIFVAAFNSEDSGVGQTADNFFKLNSDVITAAIGGNIVVDGRDVDQFKEMIPKNIAVGVEACLIKCGLSKR